MKNDEKIIAALLQSSSLTEAATKAGISRDALYKKMNKADFQVMYDKARADALQHATARLCGRLGSAIDIVQNIAENGDIAPQIRLNACQILLTTAIRLNEQMNLQKQIEEIERRLKNANFC